MTCSHCGRNDLVESDFYCDKNGRFSTYCKRCTRELQRKRVHGQKIGVRAYSKEELSSRPIEHVLEVFTKKQLAEIWGVSIPEVERIMADPWRVRERTGEPQLRYEYRVKTRRALEVA